MTTDYTEDATGTYAQIVVPGYKLVSPVVAASTTTTGNSFLRLGSFPSLTDTTEQPSGFPNSLTLAKLVGDATNVATADATDDSAPSNVITANTYKGDANYLLGFADDTRYRGADPGDTYIDWVSVSNTTANRKAETKRLLTKGGWWDHADGNRVTTTSGDKIEVIQGNYKMIVLGRQNPVTTAATAAETAAATATLAANAFISDSSGGQWIEQDATPTACVMSVEYVEKDGIWTVFQDNQAGNVTTRFHGEQTEYYTGSRRYSEVGTNPGAYDGSLSRTTHDSNDPVIVSKTWAQRIETYVGANGKPVPSMYNFTHAQAINNVVTAAEITMETTAALVTDTTVGIKVATVVGASFEIVIGASTEIVGGLRLEVGNSKLQYFNAKSVVIADKNEAIALDNKLATMRNIITNITSTISNKQQTLATSVSDLKGSVLAIEGDVTKVKDKQVEIAAEMDRITFENTFLSLSHYLA